MAICVKSVSRQMPCNHVGLKVGCCAEACAASNSSLSAKSAVSKHLPLRSLGCLTTLQAHSGLSWPGQAHSITD